MDKYIQEALEGKIVSQVDMYSPDLAYLSAQDFEGQKTVDRISHYALVAITVRLRFVHIALQGSKLTSRCS